MRISSGLSKRFARRLQPTERSGLTLVELLVVTAVVAVLFSILLPALQSARDAARRTVTQNNLRQIFVATQTYTDTYQGMMPLHLGPGSMTDKRQSGTVGVFPYCGGDLSIFQSPCDQGSQEDPATLFESFGSSYVLDCKAFSQHDVADRVVLEYSDENKRWERRTLAGRKAILRTVAEFAGGRNPQLASDKFEVETIHANFQPLARDFQEPWQTGRVRWSTMRGVYTAIPFHSTHMNVVFASGEVRAFTTQSEWEMWTGKLASNSRPADSTIATTASVKPTR